VRFEFDFQGHVCSPVPLPMWDICATDAPMPLLTMPPQSFPIAVNGR